MAAAVRGGRRCKKEDAEHGHVRKRVHAGTQRVLLPSAACPGSACCSLCLPDHGAERLPLARIGAAKSTGTRVMLGSTPAPTCPSWPWTGSQVGWISPSCVNGVLTGAGARWGKQIINLEGYQCGWQGERAAVEIPEAHRSSRPAALEVWSRAVCF